MVTMHEKESLLISSFIKYLHVQNLSDSSQVEVVFEDNEIAHVALEEVLIDCVMTHSL
jgi:hypothetical protein